MKVLSVLFLIFGLAVIANAQKAILSGKVYDANGSLIVNAKVTAIDEKGEKFEALTNENGIYELSLPFNPYSSKADFKVAKYELTVSKESFENNSIKDLVV